MRIHAYAAREARSALQPLEIEPAPLGPHDVEIAVSHCGICHSDVHLVDDDWKMSVYPLVPGHEVVGSVIACGSEVRGLTPGDQVGVGWQRSACLACRVCLEGHENLCPEREATCVGHPGGFADRIRVDARFVFPLPDGLEPAAAAPLLCGGATVYAPLRRYAAPGRHVAVLGIGGLGHLALQFARALGCEVTALSGSADKEAEARALGAHHFVATREPGALEAQTGAFDLVLSTVFAPIATTALLRALRPNGTLCVLGAQPEPLRVPAAALLLDQRHLTGSSIAPRHLIREMLALAARQGIGARVELRPLAEAAAALQRVREGRARYRVVLTA
jgi:uncharacterized zinc-type alcohol dehydrogenase-like protein